MRSIIVGASGQDGTILLEKILAENEAVLAISSGYTRLYGKGQTSVEHVDILDSLAVNRAIEGFAPTHVYYLAAYHHSSEEEKPAEFELFKKSFEVHSLGLLNFLEGIRQFKPDTRLFYASSSLIFGSNPAVDIATEETPWQPDCAYSISKVAGMHLCKYYRKKHGVFASCGIMFNHESQFRSSKFVSKKIINGVVSIKHGDQQYIEIGDIAAGADFGYAPDYVEAMVKIMNSDQPDDFIIATGEVHTVKDWLEIAFALAGLDLKGGIIYKNDVLTRKRKILAGSYTKLYQSTGWEPRHSFKEMVELLFFKQLSEKNI